MRGPAGGSGAPARGGGGTFPFAALLWDLDGTLVDSEPVHRRSMVDAGATLGIDLPDDVRDHLVGKSEEAIHRALVADCGVNIRFRGGPKSVFPPTSQGSTRSRRFPSCRRSGAWPPRAE